ncbi:MAG: sulfotransferase domain-containing protein [Alphaproteobacteria bacterium]|nr:sulfotransferase domain-containing protein [Alphaproteobacteria bacterium]MCB9695770.1 sulfotransferase domain-containing protein [Alphaproteobacteria bacterium]
MALPQIAIFGCPRSGTSWLGQLFNASEHVAYRYQPLFSFEFKDWFGRRGVDASSLEAFGRALLDAKSAFVLQDLRPEKVLPATHLVWKEVRYHHLMPSLVAEPGLQHLIYIHRPALDVINSWYQAPKEFREGQDIRAEYLNAPSKNTDSSEWNGYSRWKDSMALALRLRSQHPEKVVLVSYDRLRSDPESCLEQLFECTGIPFTEQVRTFVAASTTRHEPDAYSVFRNERTPLTLPDDIIDHLRTDEEGVRLSATAESLSI